MRIISAADHEIERLREALAAEEISRINVEHELREFASVVLALSKNGVILTEGNTIAQDKFFDIYDCALKKKLRWGDK